jgi:deoxycytidine triphosphate deaminase
MLTGDQIAALGIIRNADDSNFRASSYDLRAGKIIAPGGKVLNQHLVPPQGIVEIVSKETVKMPRHVCGFAAVKTSLSTKGLLALNIGLIDPLYEGPIASFLLNFSKTDIFIEEGDVFLRTHYVEIEDPKQRAKDNIQSEEDYVRERKKGIAAQFGDTFLNIDAIVRGHVVKYGLGALAFVGGVALIITFSSYLATTASVHTLRGWIDPSASMKADLERTNGQMAAARAETAQLRLEVAQLRKCLSQSRSLPPNTAQPVRC